MGQARNVALIIAITAAMALATAAIAYLFDFIPFSSPATTTTTTAAEAGTNNSSSSPAAGPGARLAAPVAIAFKAGR